jgi:cell division protein FtsB
LTHSQERMRELARMRLLDIIVIYLRVVIVTHSIHMERAIPGLTREQLISAILYKEEIARGEAET